MQVAGQLMNAQVALSDRCCGESGTLGSSRPDIASQLRFRKIEEINQGLQAIAQEGNQTTMLTSCPACQQGLLKYQQETGIKTDYIVIELAKRMLGETWQRDFVAKAKAGGVEQVLL